MNWFRYWADLFMLFRIGQAYSPYIRPICFMIMPAHEDWWWQYRRNHNPANDNGDHDGS
jgi:hypothetical protein